MDKKMDEKLTTEENQDLIHMAQESVNNMNKNVLEDNCVFGKNIRNALKFALKTHQGYQKQVRKGKDTPYITHPLTVAIILASVGASQDMVIAGILHDTIEDSIPEKKVTYEMIKERFGVIVADIVNDVTEQDKDLPWLKRKQLALKHIETIDRPSIWVKSADVISNVSEILDDYGRDGDSVFERFKATKEETLENSKAVLTALLSRWSGFEENSMVNDLKVLLKQINELIVE